jgi:hypothetical protein
MKVERELSVSAKLHPCFVMRNIQNAPEWLRGWLSRCISVPALRLCGYRSVRVETSPFSRAPDVGGRITEPRNDVASGAPERRDGKLLAKDCLDLAIVL